MGGDITNSWSSVASIAGNNAALAPYAAPGGFNDFDMMVSIYIIRSSDFVALYMYRDIGFQAGG